ncbi:unnamed protein product [Rhizoctonia solani]|uniref:Uncharacterized protein n=1 Tax=Rhizoctonia solani TaxID=456999 RepID=A0A8H3CC96_9AGAM|nr:unnamed protein product [Rhizoctonia solani]
MSHPETTKTTQTSHPVGSASSHSSVDRDWIEHVRWDGEFHLLNNVTYGQGLEVKKLREIVMMSTIVPAWLSNIESPEWAFYNKRRLRNSAEDLSFNISLAGFTLEDKDEDLSFDVQESLGFVLHIPRHAAALNIHFSDLEPVEADRRHPLDTLGSLVWDLQSDGCIVYRTERKLAIPCRPRHARQENMGEIQPDACAFIPMPSIPSLVTSVSVALSCFPSTDSTIPSHRYALDWVTEYKRDHNKLDSRRQVAEGLVSALYQRRAYGFPNHFVFGSAHYSRTTIEVIAATWVRSDEPANPGANPQEAKSESAVPPGDQKINPLGSSLQGGDMASGPSRAGDEVGGANTSPTIEDIKKQNKIVMYTIATYDMTVYSDMLQLYLLMRHTLTLAKQYKKEIEGDKYARVGKILKEAKDVYEWPPPPRPQSDRGTKRQNTGQSKYSGSLASVSENEPNDMSIDPYEDSDDSWVSEELEPPHDAGPTREIAGEVASYTLRNYAYEKGAEACGFGGPHSARPPVSQTF